MCAQNRLQVTERDKGKRFGDSKEGAKDDSSKYLSTYSTYTVCWVVYVLHIQCIHDINAEFETSA